MKVSTEIDNNFGYEKNTQLVDNIPLREDLFKGIKLHKKQNTENKLHTKKYSNYFFFNFR